MYKITYERGYIMYFEEAFDQIKTSLADSKPKAGDEHLAIQVRIKDSDCGGTFYIEQKDGSFHIEPYNYFDYDADIETSFSDFKSVADGKTDFKKAVEQGKIIVTGDFDAIAELAKKLKKPVKKRTVKKASEKASTSVKKSAKKKTD